MGLLSLIQPKEYEKIIIAARRHWFTFLPYLFFYALLALLPVGLYFLLRVVFPALFTGPISLPRLILCASVYYLSITLFLYSYFVTFYLDLTVVTNDRMVDIEQKSLFGRTVAEVDLYQIQDATSEVNGIFASMFNYGNVLIQTAGSIPKFTLHNVPNPHALRQQILDLSAEDKKYHSK